MDYSAITAPIDWTGLIGGIGAVAALIVVVLAVIKGAWHIAEFIDDRWDHTYDDLYFEDEGDLRDYLHDKRMYNADDFDEIDAEILRDLDPLWDEDGLE